MAIDDKEGGVDIKKGGELVSWLQKDKGENGPHQDKVVSGIGGFAALFRANFADYERPCLVSATDGVGTKVVLAAEYNRYEGVGQDLVGMCVNDLLCCGADPLFFLDYFACGKLELEVAQVFLKGLKAACNEAGCALIGGETAEMPGVYQGKDFDCAGFSVGVVDEPKAYGPHRVNAGDRVIGFPSSGCHSNGYSLLRKIFAADMDDWIDQLMTPTRLYTKLIKGLESVVSINALAHMTGGGLDNLLRVLPDNTSVQLNAWEIPKIFLEVKKRGEMSWDSLLTTLNCGIGMTLIVSSSEYSKFLDYCAEKKISFVDFGKVVVAEEKKWILDYNELEKVNL